MNTDLETAAREWWIWPTGVTNIESDSSLIDHREIDQWVRVIEYSAYAKALKRIEELEEELKSNKKHWEKMFDDARATALNHSKELSYRAKRIEELDGELTSLKINAQTLVRIPSASGRSERVLCGLKLENQLTKERERVAELEAELAGLAKLNETLASYANAGENLEKALTKERQISKLLEESLMFYADPSTYFAIGLLADKPCGDFINDGSDCEDEDLGIVHKPGKLARTALAEVQKLRGE